MSHTSNAELIAFLQRIPSLKENISGGFYDNGLWWVKFGIDIENHNAWNAVQELACIINYLSINERLPTRFYPVSPAPYLNGGPREFLSWIIEGTDKEFTSTNLKEWLEARLPNPVDDIKQWQIE